VLALMPLDAKPLGSHTLDLLIERVHFLVATLGAGFDRFIGAYLVQRLLYGQFLCFGHDSGPLSERLVAGWNPEVTYNIRAGRAVAQISALPDRLLDPGQWP
jgi:hypothetical protein